MEEHFIELLFHHRHILHSIALRHTTAGSSSIPVCWVDVLFARLAEAVVIVVGASASLSAPNSALPLTVKKQQEEVNVRAAALLPGMCMECVRIFT